MAWDFSPTGETVRKFLPKVGLKRINLNREAVQILTEHGDFGSYLYRFKLADTDACECGHGPESVEHLVRFCELDYRQRARNIFLSSTVPSGFNWDDWGTVVLNNHPEDFLKLCKSLMG